MTWGTVPWKENCRWGAKLARGEERGGADVRVERAFNAGLVHATVKCPDRTR